MRDFSYSDNEQLDNEVVEHLIKQRKRKIFKQQILYTIILLGILVVVGMWVFRKTVYVELDGYISTDVNNLRLDEDIYFLGSNFDVGEIVMPGDTIFSYVFAGHFYKQDNLDNEADIVVRNRDDHTKYNLARHDIEVLRVRIAELERQLATEDHNIRFGLSDNRNKLRTEQELAEAREQYKAARRKLGVLYNAAAQTDVATAKIRNRSYSNLNITDPSVIARLEELGLLRYSLANDTAIITRKYFAAFSLVLRGEPILSSTSMDLRNNNLSVVSYVMSDQMEHINYNSTATVFVNDNVHFTAHVMMLGSRTQEIPGSLRSSLSRDYTASIVVFDVDSNQNIPLWSLADHVPVKVRVNKFRDREPRPDDYIIYNTSSGVNDTIIDMHRSHNCYHKTHRGRVRKGRAL